MCRQAASELSGSLGFGYIRSWGRKMLNTLMSSYIGDHVWLMTSRQTVPDLEENDSDWFLYLPFVDVRVVYGVGEADGR